MKVIVLVLLVLIISGCYAGVRVKAGGECYVTGIMIAYHDPCKDEKEKP